MKKILVSIPEGIYEILDSGLRGKIGERDSEIIRTIVISYLSEKGYLDKESGYSE